VTENHAPLDPAKAIYKFFRPSVAIVRHTVGIYRLSAEIIRRIDDLGHRLVDSFRHIVDLLHHLDDSLHHLDAVFHPGKLHLSGVTLLLYAGKTRRYPFDGVCSSVNTI
jgi:hypothetical protein